MDASRVAVRVDEGIAYLTGAFETLDDADFLGAMVAEVEGIIDMEDDLEVDVL